jgi:hypothetical protein
VPVARKSTRSSTRRSATFKEPAALGQLNRSLESAQKALTELRKHAGSGAGKGTKTLHGGLQKVVASAKTDTRKLTTELKRDFKQAQKTVASGASSKAKTRTTTGRRTTDRTTAKRSTRKSS